MATGQYKLTTDVGYVGDYILKLSVIDGKLRIKSPQANTEEPMRSCLWPVSH